MQQSWTLSFENFGKIKSGQIDIAPLVLIIGDNNSGKSYVMSLLWGVLTEGRTLFPKDTPTSESYKAIDAFLERVMGDNQSLTAEESELFIHWFNNLLRTKKQDLTQRIFGKKVPISSLQICNYHRKKTLELKFDEKDHQDNMRYSSGKHYVRIPYVKTEPSSAAERYRMAKYITWILLMDGLSAPLNPLAMGGRALGEALYLPASRTGFMLSYPALVQYMLESVTQDDIDGRIKFTLPVQRFLQGLIDLDKKSTSKFADISEYMEERILLGSMEQKKGMLPSFSYKPVGRNDELPLYLTSSLVTELSPLILFLKSRTTYKTLFFEEAEAHLHPRVQRILATALVKIVNREMPVFMTTHSDIILQQLNNLIKLSSHPEQENLMQQFNYQDEDLLLPENVKAYQFTATGGDTVITKIEATPYGFPAETFNQVLLDLNEETIAFQVEDEDE